MDSLAGGCDSVIKPPSRVATSQDFFGFVMLRDSQKRYRLFDLRLACGADAKQRPQPDGFQRLDSEVCTSPKVASQDSAVRDCGFITRWLLLACLLAGSLRGWGFLLVHEPFDYSDGPLVTVSGGVWAHHSGSITGEVNVVSSRVFLTQTETEDVSVLLPGQPYSAATNTLLYAGFTLNVAQTPSGDGDVFAHFKAAGTSGAQRGKVFVTTNGAAPGSYRVGVASAASAPSAIVPADLSFDTDYTFLLRYTPSNAACALWLNPVGEDLPTVQAFDSSSTISVAAFALRQSLSSGDGMGGLLLDHLNVGTTFGAVLTNLPAPLPPFLIGQSQSLAVARGDEVALSVVAGGTAPLSYQWQFHATNLAGATQSSLVLPNVTEAQAGPYGVTVTNVAGVTNSETVHLMVTNPPPATLGFSLMTYNTRGFGTTDWSTNAPQVQAIGRHLLALQPDIVTFQEIPYTNTWQMANWVIAYLPGYQLATNSVTDGLIRSVIASRFPIARSKSWLPHADLEPFGYTNANFTRDLFEAEINVPGFPQPLHVFTTHLKSGTDSSDDAARRAAEASAISNFFVTGFLTSNALRPYLLTGDLNEDIARPATGSQQPVQRLTNGTGLRLTTPRNPVTGGDQTFSIQASLNRRYDYILPGALLFANIASNQVFRTDLPANPPPPLLTNDSTVASDHLPVLMAFHHPYDKPFRLLSISRDDPAVALTWESVPGQSYRVDGASNLTAWTALISSLLATNTTCSFTTNPGGGDQFFRVRREP